MATAMGSQGGQVECVQRKLTKQNEMLLSKYSAVSKPDHAHFYLTTPTFTRCGY